MWTQILLFALALFVLPQSAQAATTINVTNQGTTAYIFDGGAPNQTLSLTRGQTYIFQVNTPGHPFNITTALGLPVQAFVNPGLSGNGAAVGTVTFTVPTSGPPATLFYQCGVHTVMQGTINLVAAAPVPATGGLAALAIAALALGAGLIELRRRRAIA
jgi:hypothetical protein